MPLRTSLLPFPRPFSSLHKTRAYRSAPQSLLPSLPSSPPSSRPWPIAVWLLLFALALSSSACKQKPPTPPIPTDPACLRSYDRLLSLLRSHSSADPGEAKALKKRLTDLATPSGKRSALQTCSTTLSRLHTDFLARHKALTTFQRQLACTSNAPSFAAFRSCYLSPPPTSAPLSPPPTSAPLSPPPTSAPLSPSSQRATPSLPTPRRRTTP